MVIAFVGIDGCGKSSIINYVYDYLLSKGYKVLNIKPNSNDCESSKLLSKVKNKYRSYENYTGRLINEKIADELAFELFRTSTRIEKERNEYDFILLDRWSSCQEIYDKVWFVWNDYIKACLDLCVTPDITILIVADLKLIEQRLIKRGNIKETENMIALSRVNKMYNEFSEKNSWNIIQNNKDIKVAGDMVIKLIGEHIDVEKDF